VSHIKGLTDGLARSAMTAKTKASVLNSWNQNPERQHDISLFNLSKYRAMFLRRVTFIIHDPSALNVIPIFNVRRLSYKRIVHGDNVTVIEKEIDNLVTDDLVAPFCQRKCCRRNFCFICRFRMIATK
jgi:hypothetical protein